MAEWLELCVWVKGDPEKLPSAQDIAIALLKLGFERIDDVCIHDVTKMRRSET